MTVSRLPNNDGGIQPTILTAKGDLLTATAASTIKNLPVGANDQILVADSTQSTGMAWKSYGAQSMAGKNFCIGGGFDNWQRGTSFTSFSPSYIADRFQGSIGTMTAGTLTISRVVSGLAGFQYALRFQRNSGATTTGNGYITYSLDSVNTIPLQGKTITISFYARAGANYSASANGLLFVVNTGTGTDENINNGYTGQVTLGNPTATLTTSWQRFTYTYSVGSTANEIGLYWQYAGTGTAGANDYFEITGVQLELGSTATPFSRAGGSIGGELALCQRYYWRQNGFGTANAAFALNGVVSATTQAVVNIFPPAEFRVAPTSLDYSNIGFYVFRTGGNFAVTPSINVSMTKAVVLVLTASGLTVNDSGIVNQQSAGTAYLGLSAEL